MRRRPGKYSLVKEMTRLKSFFVAVLFIMAHSLQGAAPLHGKERLRELAVFPVLNLTLQLDFNFSGRQWRISDGRSLADEIAGMRDELKSRPDDIERILRLSYLLRQNDQTDEAKLCDQKAEELCRKRIALKPQDGLLLVELGEALGADKQAEAESVLRKSVLVSSNDWRCWSSLGCFLEAKSYQLLGPEHPAHYSSPSPETLQKMLDYRPSSDALKTSEELSREAARCLERAAALGGRDREMWLQHAGYAFIAYWRDRFYRHAHEREPMDAASLGMGAAFKSLIPDLRQASALSPRDYRLICLPAYLEWGAVMAETQAAGKTNSPAEMLPEESRRFIHEAMTRLEDLSQETDRKTAAGALECHGFLAMAMADSMPSLPDFRRAVALDPTREQSWDMFLAASPDSEMTEVCESRIKAKDSARNHLLLGKILTKHQKWDRAKEEAGIVLESEPENISARLMLAAMIIKQSTDDNSLEPARAQFELVRGLIEKMPASEEQSKRQREFVLNAILFNILSHYPENNKDGRTAIENFLQLNPDDEDAKQIRSAME
jgi:tetratricopeptide (TPR) repeat protein